MKHSGRRAPEWAGEWATVVTGVAVSVAISVLLFFFVDAELLLAFVVGLSGTILTLQLDLARRVERRADAFGSLDQHPEVLPVVKKLLQAAAIVLEERRSPAFVAAALHTIESCETTLDDLRRGYLRRTTGDTFPMLEQIRSCRSTIHATTLPRTDVRWWNSSAGRAYWTEHQRVMEEHGVVAERVFIIDEWTDEVQVLTHEQHLAGVKVYVVPCKDLDRDLIVNVAIYDMNFAAYEVANANGDAVDDVFTVNRTDIERFRSLFERIKTRATPLSDLTEAEATRPRRSSPTQRTSAAPSPPADDPPLAVVPTP